MPVYAPTTQDVPTKPASAPASSIDFGQAGAGCVHDSQDAVLAAEERLELRRAFINGMAGSALNGGRGHARVPSVKAQGIIPEQLLLEAV